jgi:tetratricopeptide (TPR) repeat protein
MRLFRLRSLRLKTLLRLPALILIAVVLVGLHARAVHAQTGGIDSDPADAGTGGKNTIDGKIFVRGGDRLQHRAKVQLRGMYAGEMFMFSDDIGAFTFRRLKGGTYTLIVDAGDEFEKASETVEIIEPARRREDPGVTVQVTVFLEMKRSAKTPVGTIDAAAGAVPDKAKDLYKQAVESSKSGDRKKAIDQLKQAIAIYPNFMTALNELGVQYMNLKDWDKASESLQAAIKLGPEAFYPRLNYGILLVQMKNYKGAAAELQIAVQKDGTSATAYLYLGRALVRLANFDGAEAALKKTVSIGGPEAIEAHRYLGAVYMEARDATRAADELEKYLELAPKAKDADQIRAMIKDLRAQASAKPH